MTHPNINLMTATTAAINVLVNEDAVIYVVASPAPFTEPSSFQVRNGLDSLNQPAAISASISVIAFTEASITLTGLTANTAYDFYLVAEDLFFNLGDVQSLNDTTLDLPTWKVNYPKLDSVSANDAVFNLIKEADGLDDTGYMVIIPSGSSSTPPTSEQVRAGTDSSNVSVNEGFHDSVSIADITQVSLYATTLFSNTSYDAYLVMDNEYTELQVSPSFLNFTTEGVELPEWKNGYPNITDITSNEATITANLTLTSNVYAVALPSGDTPPTSQQVRAGTNSEGISVANGLFNSKQGLLANNDGELLLENLTEGTTYDIWVVASDTDGNLQFVPIKLTIRAADPTPPEWIYGYPKLATVTVNTTEVKVNVDELGIVYGVILKEGSPVPSPAQIVAGENGSGEAVPSGHSGLVPVIGGIAESIIFSKLISGVSYVIYLVAEDVYSNLQTEAAVLEVSPTTADFGGVKGIRSIGGGSLYVYWENAYIGSYVTSYVSSYVSSYIGGSYVGSYIGSYVGSYIAYISPDGDSYIKSYDVYIRKSSPNVFESEYLWANVRNDITSVVMRTEANTDTFLRNGYLYYIGVRAIGDDFIDDNNYVKASNVAGDGSTFVEAPDRKIAKIG